MHVELTVLNGLMTLNSPDDAPSDPDYDDTAVYTKRIDNAQHLPRVGEEVSLGFTADMPVVTSFYGIEGKVTSVCWSGDLASVRVCVSVYEPRLVMRQFAAAEGWEVSDISE